MKLLTAVIAFFLVLQDVLAQTPPGFVPQVAANLPAAFEQFNTTITPGKLIPRADTASMPSLPAPNNTSPSSLYIVLMIDRNVTYNSSLTTLLHWFQPNLLATDNVLNANERNVNASSVVGASYIQPAPPTGSGPHDYTLLLFEQPPHFTVPSQYSRINPPASTAPRIGFNITEFISATNLSQPISANFFRVLNGTASQTSSVESSIAAASTSGGMTSGSMSSGSITTVTGTITGATSRTITATSTVSSAAGASSSSASASATQSSIAGGVEVKGHEREVLTGLALALLGAGMWMA